MNNRADQARLIALKEAAADVCMYCGKRALPNEPEAHVVRGPNEAGNHYHEAFGSTELCPASAIWSRIAFEART